MLILHSLNYVDDISRFMSECGLPDVCKQLFFERLYNIKNKYIKKNANLIIDTSSKSVQDIVTNIHETISLVHSND